MEKQRAVEIAASPIMANVTYNGQSIYIENVNDRGTARIYHLDQPESKKEVPVNYLMEH